MICHRSFFCAVLLGVLVVFFSSLAAEAEGVVPADQKAIADVQAGRVETARACWWGFDPADATKSLQAALDSPAGQIIIDDMDRPWAVTTIRLPSDKKIVFEPGTVVEAKRGAFLSKGACLFLANGCKNLTLEGGGATLRMHKSDYHKPPYELAEWRHALSLRGCENVLVEDLTLAESGGDGIYLGVGAGGKTNRNITIRKVVCDGNNRQGISVITAENLLIEDTALLNTRGTAPQAGIDFEPNLPGERLVNCVLRNCRSENNAGRAYHLYLGPLDEESIPVSIRFENCSSKNCDGASTSISIANRKGKRTVRGLIEYVDCRFEADKQAGVQIQGNEADGCKIRFERCEIIRQDEPDSRVAPITITAPRQLDLAAGNVEFDECLVRDTLDRQPIALHASPMAGLRNVSGSLTVESPKGKKSYTLDDEQLAKWFPSQGQIARIPQFDFDWRKAKLVKAEAVAGKAGATFRLRREAALLVWAEANKPVELAAKLEPVGQHTPKPVSIDVTSASGKTITVKPQLEDKAVVYTFTPQETGPYRVHWQGDMKETFRPVRCTTPLAILAESLGAGFIRPIGTLYFAVPAGVGRLAVVVSGSGTAETVKASVRDASGKTIEEKDNIAAPHVFVLERDETRATEIWSLVLARATEGVMEDVSVQVVGAPPVLAAKAEDLFFVNPSR